MLRYLSVSVWQRMYA